MVTTQLQRIASLRRAFSRRPALSSKRLGFEPLEHRWLLSITIDTLLDEQDGSILDGDISLRDALAAASAKEMIDFNASLNGGTILLTR